MQNTHSVPPIPPIPPIPIVAPTVGVTTVQGSPTAVWRAAVEQRSELRSQLSELRSAREEISEQLQDPMVGGANRQGLESRIQSIDAQIEAVDRQIAQANQSVAAAAAVPGAVVPPPVNRNGPPDEVYALAGLFMVVVLLPISVAFARRVWRRGSAAVAALPHDLMERFGRLEQAVDSIALEVERIGEGQRFVTRLLGERVEREPAPAMLNYKSEADRGS